MRNRFLRFAPAAELDPEPLPEGFAETLKTIGGFAIAPDQKRAAAWLLAGLECDPFPIPASIGLRRVLFSHRGRRTARLTISLYWDGGMSGRGVLVTPLWEDGKLFADVHLYDERIMIWRGWPRCPVSMIRSMLGWIFDPLQGS